MRIWQLLLIIVLYPILIESMFVAAITTTIFQLEKVYKQYEQSETILMEFARAQTSLLETSLASSGLLPGNKSAPNDYKTDLDAEIIHQSELFQSLGELQPQIAKDLKRCSEISLTIKEDLKNCDIDKHHFFNTNGLGQFRVRTYALLMEMLPILNRVHTAKVNLDSGLPDQFNSQRLAFYILSAGGLIFGIASSTTIAVIISGLISRRLKLVQENARLLTAGRQLPEVLSGSDEIHELDLALHEAALKIAALRRRENVLLEKSSSALCAVDERLRFVEVSESASNILKYQSDELRGRNFLSLFDAETSPRVKKALEEIRDFAMNRDIETIMTLGNGRTACILWKTSYKQSDRNFYFVALDITARRKLLREKQELLTAAGQDISKPLAFVSNTVSGINNLAASQTMSERTRNTLKQVSGNVDRLMALVEDLLDLEKLESGKLTIRREAVSAGEAIAAAVDSLRSLARSLEISIIEPQSDGILYADRKRLLQILTNLISNAIKYSPSGSTVRLTVNRTGQFYEISVIDQGQGIAAEEQELIFEKFYQTRNRSHAQVKSSGLGLAIVKILTAAQGGIIGVESEVGKGSRFWLRLPAQPGGAR